MDVDWGAEQRCLMSWKRGPSGRFHLVVPWSGGCCSSCWLVVRDVCCSGHCDCCSWGWCLLKSRISEEVAFAGHWPLSVSLSHDFCLVCMNNALPCSGLLQGGHPSLHWGCLSTPLVCQQATTAPSIWFVLSTRRLTNTMVQSAYFAASTDHAGPSVEEKKGGSYIIKNWAQEPWKIHYWGCDLKCYSLLSIHSHLIRFQDSLLICERQRIRAHKMPKWILVAHSVGVTVLVHAIMWETLSWPSLLRYWHNWT